MEAVKFLNDHAFATPAWAIRPEILRRIEPTGALDRIRTSQQRVLASLMSTARITRLVEQEAIDGAKAYSPTAFMADIRKGVWRELDAPSARVDAYRRNLQRAYIDLMSERLNGRAPVTDDQRGLIRGELRALNQDIARVIPRTADRATRLHLEDARDQIARALDPKFAPPAPAGPALPFGFPFIDDPMNVDSEPLVCWPDYVIRGSNR
jgi:hypothetical protein